MDDLQKEKLKEKGYVEIWKLILLSAITCGIYYLIWIKKTTELTNKAGEERSSGKELVLCFFIPLYTMYWKYTTFKRLLKMADANGVEHDEPIFYSFMSLLGPVALVHMQNLINEIAKGNRAGSSAGNAADKVREYKRLLDAGAITKDEFEAKKAELFGV